MSNPDASPLIARLAELTVLVAALERLPVMVQAAKVPSLVRAIVALSAELVTQAERQREQLAALEVDCRAHFMSAKAHGRKQVYEHH